MKIELKQGLPFVSAELFYHGRSLFLDSVLIDTGSTGTIFSADQLSKVGIWLDVEDKLRRIIGVGGSEFVFTKLIQQLTLDELTVNNFNIEVGEMNYGFEIDGIIGMDFLSQVNAVVDLAKLEIYTPSITV